MIKKILYCVIILFFFSQKSFSLELIRDAELESFTEDILSILTSGTDIDPEEINIHFINNRDINAFVINSKDMFINTGLITAADSYLEFTAVVAHELSHMTGFHVSRTKSEIARLSKSALPVYMLGIFGALTGSADTAIASMMVGTASVEGGYLSYSRTQESSADQGAIRLMCQSSIDARGLLSFFEKLQKAESSLINFSPYNQTHPMTKERYEFAKNSLAKYGGCNFKKNKELEKKFSLLRAKLIGYTYTPREVKAIYSDASNDGRYALSVSSYYNEFSEKPLYLLNQLIIEDETNPFFHELLAEVLFSRKDFNAAINEQKKAIKYYDGESDLLYMLMGNYLKYDSDMQREAIKYIKNSLRVNNSNTYSWFLLADLYSKDNLPLAHYATAERYFLLGDYPMSYKFTVKSLKEIEKNSPEWYRANDLLNIMTRKKEEEEKEE
tara:strand:+ start:2399 stop:3724 length:1326 start_codon:yes stop_codon:yes gene_type:complete